MGRRGTQGKRGCDSFLAYAYTLNPGLCCIVPLGQTDFGVGMVEYWNTGMVEWWVDSVTRLTLKRVNGGVVVEALVAWRRWRWG